MKKTLLLCALILCSVSTYSQSVSAATKSKKLNIQLDFASAKAIINLLGQKSVTDKELDDVTTLYGSQQLIRKVTSYNSENGTEARFKKTLREIVETGTVQGDDAFDWKAVKKQQAAVQSLINQLEASPTAFLDDIYNAIAPYAPNDLAVDIRACFLVGSGAGGFTIGNDNTFNVTLQRIGDDYEGLVKMVAHELYHSVQHAGRQKRKKSLPDVADPPKNIVNPYILMYNVWAEGTATRVGDFTEIKLPKAFAKTQQDEYLLNQKRSAQNFYLFENLLYRAANDSTVDMGQLYNIAFTVAFEETSYYVGYEMAKFIEKHEGKDALAAYVSKNPVAFTQHYVELYKKYPDAGVIKFSAPVEAIIKKTESLTDKL